MAEGEYKKRKLDYTNSAENLINPPEIGLKLEELAKTEAEARNIERTLQEDKVYKLLQEKLKLAEDIKAQVKAMIDVQGSFQDLERGYYGLKYRRISKSYEAEPFIENYPKYSPAVIINSVNVKALEGLIKGGLLTEDELKKNGVLQQSVGFAYVVKAE